MISLHSLWSGAHFHPNGLLPHESCEWHDFGNSAYLLRLFIYFILIRCLLIADVDRIHASASELRAESLVLPPTLDFCSFQPQTRLLPPPLGPLQVSLPSTHLAWRGDVLATTLQHHDDQLSTSSSSPRRRLVLRVQGGTRSGKVIWESQLQPSVVQGAKSGRSITSTSVLLGCRCYEHTTKNAALASMYIHMQQYLLQLSRHASILFNLKINLGVFLESVKSAAAATTATTHWWSPLNLIF